MCAIGIGYKTPFPRAGHIYSTTVLQSLKFSSVLLCFVGFKQYNSAWCLLNEKFTAASQLCCFKIVYQCWTLPRSSWCDPEWHKFKTIYDREVQWHMPSAMLQYFFVTICIPLIITRRAILYVIIIPRVNNSRVNSWQYNAPNNCCRSIWCSILASYMLQEYTKHMHQ